MIVLHKGIRGYFMSKYTFTFVKINNTFPTLFTKTIYIYIYIYYIVNNIIYTIYVK